MALIIRTQPRLCRLIVMNYDGEDVHEDLQDTQTATLQTATLVSPF